jgi:uncharacterized protein (DUF1501 family)
MNNKINNKEELHALRCADCARSDSAVTDVKPTQQLLIPAEALAGALDGLPRRAGLSRRQFLRGGLIGVASVYGASMLRVSDMWEAVQADAAGPMQRSLVCLYLNGGHDSLNAIVPNDTTQFAAYTKARSNIARIQGASSGKQVGTTPIAGTGGALAFANVLVSGSANNGDTKGLDTLFGDGTGGAGSNLALFPAADYTPPNLSHFESRDYWFAGALQELQTGWLGRWLDAYGSNANPLQAVSLDSSLSKTIRSATAPVCALDGLSGKQFTAPGANGSVDATGTVGKLDGVAAGNPALARSRGIFGQTVEVSNRLGALQAPSGGAGYPPNSDLSNRLQLAATLLSAGLGTRIITIDWGSFDTHGDQPATQDPQLAVLSRALAAFMDDLAARGIEQNVVTMVFSEFGRRVASNDSMGTDHGAGGLMMVSGSSVHGGMLGDHPGVTTTDDNGDLVVATDFRSVYQALIADWLGGDPGAVLPGGPFPGLPRQLAG